LVHLAIDTTRVGEGWSERFRTAADLKKSQQFLFVTLGEVAVEKWPINCLVTTVGSVDDFKAREWVARIEREEPGEAQAEAFQIVFREVISGDLINQERCFEPGTSGPTGYCGNFLEMAGESGIGNGIGWEEQAREPTPEVKRPTQMG
jgi:hypothetical protein